MASTPNYPSGSAPSWQPLGPVSVLAGGSQVWSGRVNSIAIDPSNPKRIFIGAAQGGVWRTTDGGATWTPLTDSKCSLAMGSVTIDPGDSNTIYAGTGELNNSADSYYGCGVLKSVDGGDHWDQLGIGTFVSTTSASARISKVVVDRSNSKSVLVAASNGLWRSTDGGSSWSLVIQNPVTGGGGVVSDVVQDVTNPLVFYAAQGASGGANSNAPTNGVYKSTDGGATWTRATTFPITNVGRINLAVASNGAIYAAVQNSASGGSTFGNLLGIYISSDGGTTWIPRNPSNGATMCNAQCWYSMQIAVDPTNPLTVYFGGLSLYKSIDGGTTFTDIGLQIHVDQHAFAFGSSATTLYAGNDGGVFTSPDGGATWTSLNATLAISQFYGGISVSPTSSTTILGGTQDNGTLEWNGTAPWPAVIGGDGGYTALDQVTGATAFGETQWTAGSGFSGPRRRDANGSGFILRVTGINAADNAAFIPPMVIDPARPRVLFFGTRNLYRTANSGDLWTAIGSGLVTSNGVINAIGVAVSDSMTVYVGSTDARVAYTHDLGATWTSATGLPTAAITDIAVDSRDARTAIVTFGGFQGSHVWRTTDGGSSWSNLTGDLPNIPVLAVVIEPGSHDIDVGTDIGVFTLRNGTTSWAPVLNGLPNVAVYDLVFDAPRSRLIAATHGRGMFSLDVTMTALRGDVTGPNGAPDGSIGPNDAQAILAMVVGNSPPAGSVRYPNADANCDGQITALDALVVLMKSVNINTGTCVGTIH